MLQITKLFVLLISFLELLQNKNLICDFIACILEINHKKSLLIFLIQLYLLYFQTRIFHNFNYIFKLHH